MPAEHASARDCDNAVLRGEQWRLSARGQYLECQSPQLPAEHSWKEQLVRAALQVHEEHRSRRLPSQTRPQTMARPQLPFGQSAAIWQLDNGKWKWATYTTTLWRYARGENGLKWAELPLYDMRAKAGESPYTKLDSYPYMANLGTSRTKTVIMCCIASSWKFWNDPNSPWGALGRVPGTHGGGDRSIVLFADMHAQTAPWNAAGMF
jgi:hypothetical protein